MEPEQYILKKKAIQAMQYDGTTAGAYEILAWVHRNKGQGHLESGYESQGPDLLHIGEEPSEVPNQAWVIMADGKFNWTYNSNFQATYELPPKDADPIQHIGPYGYGVHPGE